MKPTVDCSFSEENVVYGGVPFINQVGPSTCGVYTIKEIHISKKAAEITMGTEENPYASDRIVLTIAYTVWNEEL